MLFIYGMQLHVLVYAYILENFCQANEHICHCTLFIHIFVLRILTIYSSYS